MRDRENQRVAGTANNRIFVTFTDSTHAIRGETSVAVETQ
jgi:hypothetical protein